MRQRHHPPNCPVKPWTQRARVTTSCQAGWRTQASNFPFGLVCLHNPDGELDPSSHRFTQQVFTDRIDGPLPSGCGLSTYRCQPLRVLHERKKGLILPESEPINPGMTTAPGTMRHTGSTVLCSFQLSLLRKGSLEDHFQKITDIIEAASHAILAACGELEQRNGPESQGVEGPGGSESGTAFCSLPVLSRVSSQAPQAPGSLRGSKPF